MKSNILTLSVPYIPVSIGNGRIFTPVALRGLILRLILMPKFVSVKFQTHAIRTTVKKVTVNFLGISKCDILWLYLLKVYCHCFYLFAGIARKWKWHFKLVSIILEAENPVLQRNISWPIVKFSTVCLQQKRFPSNIRMKRPKRTSKRFHSTKWRPHGDKNVYGRLYTILRYFILFCALPFAKWLTQKQFTKSSKSSNARDIWPWARPYPTRLYRHLPVGFNKRVQRNSAQERHAMM